jgi:uncharacterized membrane protein YcaP (DUF421 family)
MAETELRSIARERGFASLDEVSLIALEPNGHISILGSEAAARWRREREPSA